MIRSRKLRKMWDEEPEMVPNQRWPRCLRIVFAALLRTAAAQYYGPPPPSIDIKPDPPLLNAMVGALYSVTFTATGGNGPYAWSVTSGGFRPAQSLIQQPES